MTSLVRGGGGLPTRALALALGIWVLSRAPALALGDGQDARGGGQPAGWGRHNTGVGTLPYGGPMLYPGFYGFGLGYHPGYGYGKGSLATGNAGGYPFYAGPGYPHPAPPLRRFSRMEPFLFNGGPGFGGPGTPYYAPTGPLVVDPPVVTIGNGREFGYTGDFGCFTGMRPYPETYFAPYAAAAAATGSSSGAGAPNPSESPSENPPLPPPSAGYGSPSTSTAPAVDRSVGLAAYDGRLGIDGVPVVDADGVRGLRVSRVFPATAAEAAGLRAGDVIHTVNDYRTERPGNLGWIAAHASPDNVLKMSVRTAADGKERSVTVRLR